jgi:hypothetical protein
MNAFTRSCLCALLAAAPFVARADAVNGPHYPDVVSTERGIETSSAFVLLPSSVPGTMTVNLCSECKATTLTVNAQTKFLIGTAAVPLAQFKSRLAGAPSTSMMVFAAIKEPVALRVVLPGAPAARATTARPR